MLEKEKDDVFNFTSFLKILINIRMQMTERWEQRTKDDNSRCIFCCTEREKDGKERERVN